MERSTNSATIASAKKIQRSIADRQAQPERRTLVVDEPQLHVVADHAHGQVAREQRFARSLVTRSAATTAAAVVQNSRDQRRLPSSSFALHLMHRRACGSAVEPLETDLFAALLALAEFLRCLKQPRSAWFTCQR